MSGRASLRIVQLGFATTTQDHGRPHLAHLGVPTAGAVDRRTHDLVNRLVGNHSSTVTIETMGALVVEALRPVIVASSTDGARHTLSPGDSLRIDAPPGAVWAYLAVRGGLVIDPVLGSRSYDTLGHVGPDLLADGAELTIGPDPGTELPADHAPRRPIHDRVIRVWDGPQHDWFVGGTYDLVQRSWTVTNEISRVGVRLAAGDMVRSPHSQPQMSSIGLVEGAVQVTPAGEPIVMLANHPTTGGYPVIAVVDPDDLPVLVQARPGAEVTFRRV